MWRGLQGGYPDPPQKIFEQPETPVKKDPHVARLTSGQSRSLLSFSFMMSRRDFGRAEVTCSGPPTRPRSALEGSFPGVQLGIPLSVVTSVRRALALPPKCPCRSLTR